MSKVDKFIELKREIVASISDNDLDKVLSMRNRNDDEIDDSLWELYNEVASRLVEPEYTDPEKFGDLLEDPEVIKYANECAEIDCISEVINREGGYDSRIHQLADMIDSIGY